MFVVIRAAGWLTRDPLLRVRGSRSEGRLVGRRSGGRGGSPAIAWSAQGAGWLLTQLIPLLVRLALEAQSKLEVAGLRSQRDRLATEWGLPAAGAATDEAVDSPKTR